MARAPESGTVADLPRGRPGVGKTYAMPEAGQRLASAGADAAVGFVEPGG